MPDHALVDNDEAFYLQVLHAIAHLAKHYST